MKYIYWIHVGPNFYYTINAVSNPDFFIPSPKV